MEALACPSIRCTALTLAPADTARLAALCRRSCGVIDGVVVLAFSAGWAVISARRARSAEEKANDYHDRDETRWLLGMARKCSREAPRITFIKLFLAVGDSRYKSRRTLVSNTTTPVE
jgi:hypothetical protein